MTMPNTDITSNPMPTDGITADGVKPTSGTNLDDAPMRTIELCEVPNVWECVGLCGLVLASLATLFVCYLFRTGRDLSLPFLVVQSLVLLAALGLCINGWRRRDVLHWGVGCVCGILALGIGAFGMLGKSLGSLDKEYTFIVRVTDEATGRPIPNAKATLFEPEFRKDGRISNADNNGQCTIPYLFFGGCSESPVCRIGHVDFRGINIEIEADGFALTNVRLADVLGNAWSIHDPPPPIEIRLSPKK